MKLDTAIHQGDRETQQDRFVIQHTYEGVACHVLDGHGERGGDVASLVATCLEADVLPRFNIAEEGPEIVRGLQNMASRFEKAGSTLSSVYIFGEKAYAFILGDSPVIVIHKGVVSRLPLHDINNAAEVDLRLKAGLKRDERLPNHLFLDDQSGLSCFRALGDSVFKECLGREAESHEISDWDYIIVASDGLKLNDNDILSTISTGSQSMLDKNLEFLRENSIDNTTIVIISK